MSEKTLKELGQEAEANYRYYKSAVDTKQNLQDSAWDVEERLYDVEHGHIGASPEEQARLKTVSEHAVMLNELAGDALQAAHEGGKEFYHQNAAQLHDMATMMARLSGVEIKEKQPESKVERNDSLRE